MNRGRSGFKNQPRILDQAAKDRFLGDSLGGAIFGATADTLNECKTGLVFGLPAANWNWVQYVDVGMPIFLFNYSDKMMHGIFRAVSPGTQNINPKGWTRISGTSYTRYPAQVRVELFEQCKPIVDRDFKQAIAGAFFTEKQFNYQLTRTEARRLCEMFSKSAGRRLYQATAQPDANREAAVPVSRGVQGTTHPPAPPAPGSPTLGHQADLNRRPSLSSSTGSSDLRKSKSWVDNPGTNPSPNSTADPQAELSKLQDTSTSRSQQSLEEAAQQSQPSCSPDAGLSHRASQRDRSAPPGFQKNAPSVEAAANGEAKGNLVPTPNAWFKSKGIQPTAVPFRPTAVAKPRSGRKTAKGDQTGLSGSQQGQSPAEEEQDTAEAAEEEEDQDVKRSRRDHTPNTKVLKPAGQEVQIPQQHAQEEEEQPSQAARSQRDSIAALSEAEERAATASQQGSGEEDVHMLGTTPPKPGTHQMAADVGSSSSSRQGHSIYLIGGGTDNSSNMWLNTVDIYSPETDSCMPALALPKESAYGSAVTIGHRLFYVGGGNGIDWFSSMLRLALNEEDAEWQQMADMHVGRGSLCTAMQGYMLWAVGGRDAHTFHSSTECFHPGQNRWTWGPSTLTKRFAAASGFLNNAIYITGGFDASAYTGTGERMDPREGKWNPIADMLSARGSHACAVLDDKLYAVGGWAALKPLREAEVYDPRADRWRAIAPMNDTRAYFAGVTCQGAFYALGGLSPQSGGIPNYRTTIEKYDPVHDTWEVMPTPTDGLPARAFMSACVV